MRALLPVFALSLVAGCGRGPASFVRSDTTLGRVVIYRNGVAIGAACFALGSRRLAAV
mgnify:CR=1 FL=1